MGLKQCPFCAEEIQEEAVVCRFCRFDLKTGQSLAAPAPAPKDPRAKIGIWEGVKIGCGIFIVFPLILLGLLLVGVVVFGRPVAAEFSKMQQALFPANSNQGYFSTNTFQSFGRVGGDASRSLDAEQMKKALEKVLSGAQERSQQ